MIKSFAKEVGKDVTVFEPACGFGLMARHIDPSCSYKGIDLNEKFLEFGRSRGLDIKRGNVFDKHCYVKSDVVILIDIIHHMPSDRLEDLFANIFSSATKRVVILEPSFVNVEEKLGILGKPVDWLFKKLDSDGTNEIVKWPSSAEYHEIFASASKGFAFGPPKIKTIGLYYLVTYDAQA